MVTLLVKVNNETREIISVKKVNAKFYEICKEISSNVNFSKNYDALVSLTKSSLSGFGFYNENVYMLKSSTFSFYLFQKEKQDKVYFLALENQVVQISLSNKKAKTLLNTKGKIL